MTALADQPVAAETTESARTGRWPRWALAGLLAATAVLYLWNLSASGYGNTFYAAAAQAGSQSWSAWFFGSLDAQNFITVDKPPASLWVTGLSVRLFGMNSWSVMAPQALMGVAAVACCIARCDARSGDPDHGAAAGLLAGAVLAVTPAAALMFRFNNPDALLVLLLTVAAYCLMRAASAASWRWLLLVGVVMGTAFLTKMLQGFLVLPGFGLAYLLVAPTSWGKRVLHLLGAVAALIAAAGWWVLAVQLTPESARPYIGGSTDNTVLDLALGYNGINRLLGHHRKGTPLGDWGGSSLPMLGGRTGLHRLFIGEMGNEISWLIRGGVVRRRVRDVSGRASGVEPGRIVRVADVGRMVVGDRCGVQLHGRNGPPLLHGRAGSRGRRAGGHRRRVGVATEVELGWPLRAGRDDRAGRCPVGELAAPQRFWPGMAAWLIVVLALVSAVGVLWPRPPVVALLAGCLAGLAGTAAFSVATAATPHHGTMPSAVRSSQVTGAWINDEATNARTGRPAGRHAHDVVGGDERFAVSGRPRNRLRHIGDGRWRLER